MLELFLFFHSFLLFVICTVVFYYGFGIDKKSSLHPMNMQICCEIFQMKKTENLNKLDIRVKDFCIILAIQYWQQ